MMTEETKNNAPAIAINNQYIKDLSLEIPYAPEIFREIKGSPKVNLDIDINANKMHDSYYNVELKISLNGDLEDKKLFILELTYASVVSLNVPAEHIEPLLLIEIPRLIFPFARNVVTTCLTEGGLPPFMINPIDFAALYTAKKLKEAKAKEQPENKN